MRTTITATLLALLLTACPGKPEAPGQTVPFWIETEELSILVEGDPAAFEQHAQQVLMRIETVDPALVRPGIALWATPDDPTPYLPGAPKLVRIGRVVAVEPRGGGY